MPRKPKDDVAASMTITLRLTPDDRERIERQIETRAAELPEKSMSALLRRLVRDGEEGILLRLPAEERGLLDRLVSDRTAELARLGVYEAHVTASSVLVGLIRDAAKARGLVASAPHAPSAAPQPVKHEATAKAPAKRHAAPDPASIQAALVAATERGAKQAEIAKKAGIDSGQLSRFKREGSGLSPENLTKLAEALEKND